MGRKGRKVKRTGSRPRARTLSGEEVTRLVKELVSKPSTEVDAELEVTDGSGVPQSGYLSPTYYKKLVPLTEQEQAELLEK